MVFRRSDPHRALNSGTYAPGEKNGRERERERERFSLFVRSPPRNLRVSKAIGHPRVVFSGLFTSTRLSGGRSENYIKIVSHTERTKSLPATRIASECMGNSWLPPPERCTNISRSTQESTRYTPHSLSVSTYSRYLRSTFGPRAGCENEVGDKSAAGERYFLDTFTRFS